MYLSPRRRLLGALALLLSAAACAPATAPHTGAASGTAPAARRAPLPAPQPPDGKWLRDAAGHEYFGEQVKLPPGSYAWLNPEKTRARLPYGVDVEVLAHDDQGLTIKVYRTDDEPAPPPRRTTPSKEDLERVAQSYEPQVEKGDGVQLVPFDAGLPQRGQWRNGFAVADVDGDGHLDIVFGPPRKSPRPPVILRGDGAGHWTLWREARFPDLPFDYGDAAVADLNGDGHADVVLASHLRGIVATVGDGQGRFTAWSKGIEFGMPGTDHPPGFTSRAIAIADWNRDGRPDVIALGEGPHLMIATRRSAVEQGSRGIVVYLNDGDGTWTKRAEVGSGSFGSTLAVADVDGDGLLDIVAGSDRRGFRGILNLGQPDGSWREVEIAELRPDAIPHAVAVGDFDGDGRKDIAVGYQTSELGVDRRGIDVLFARGGGWQRKTLVADESGETIGALATGDIDGDGALDLVAVDDGGALLVFRGDGRGGFAREPVETPFQTERCAGYGLLLRNLDGAPGDEIVASFAGESDENPLTGGAPCRSQGSLHAWKARLD